MRLSLSCFALALTLCAVSARGQSASPAPAPLTVIRAGTLLDGVSEKQALARPLPNAHSILELVVHVGTWMDVVARRLAGNVVDSTTVPDWSDVTKRSWRGVIEELERAQSRLCDAVARMSTDDLQSPVPGKQLTKHEEILGVLNHTVYHSGQISLLKKS